MNWLSTILVLTAAFVVVFLQGTVNSLRYLLGVPYGAPFNPLTPATLRLDPEFDTLRSDPEFQKLVQDHVVDKATP